MGGHHSAIVGRFSMKATMQSLVATFIEFTLIDFPSLIEEEI